MRLSILLSGFLSLSVLMPLPCLGEGRVGMVTRDFVDSARQNWQVTGPRPLRTSIWYPAADDATESESPGKPFFDVGAVATAPAVSPRRRQYPLVILSHGTGGSALQMMWLGRELARRGYIAAAVNHHGNTSAERERAAQGFLLFWERATDLSAVLDKLLDDPQIGWRIDRQRIGAAGFSLGGYTVITLAGGIFSLDQFETFCGSPQRDFTCEPQPEFPEAHERFAELKKTDRVVKASLGRSGHSYRDHRIRAVFAIAPAIGSGFTKSSLRKVDVPVHVVVGEGDEVTPANTNARVIANTIPGAKLTVLPGAIAHYTFLAPCTEEGRSALPICRDAEGIDRKDVHRQVGQLASEFFEAAWPRAAADS